MHILFFLFVPFCGILAQTDEFVTEIPLFEIVGEDTIKTMVYPDIYVYPERALYTKNQEEQYRKLIRDVKKTLPHAKMIYATLIETYEYIMTLPDDKQREAHLKRMEKQLFEDYKPILKKLTLTQGKLLIRLVDRECNQSSYEILKAFLGSFRAGFWNLFAGIFGASLKTEWDPEGKDAAAERIVQMVEMGVL
ncbi:DUF4294 domain-containing protein [Bacteroidales bacterium OttesenSCG-928-M06]|nr:DUF4294 domain-containing protein [Bacteroidales bacterium OttesenSCG-928-M06]